MSLLYFRNQWAVEQVIHILKLKKRYLRVRQKQKKTFIYLLRSGVTPLENDDDDERDSSKPFVELYKRCFESTSFNDELKNLANVDMVDIYEVKYTKALKIKSHVFILHINS